MLGARNTIGAAVLLTALLAGCGGSDDDTTDASASPDASTTSPTTSVPGADSTGTTVADTAPSTMAPTSAPATTPPPTTTPATTASSTPPATVSSTVMPSPSGEATAVVEIDGERFEFLVIQCLRDQPSVFGDQIIEMTLDGVPVDTPDELIEPLLGVMDPDTDMLPLLEPVLEFGPALTVSRFEGGGDYVVVYDLADIEYLSDPDPLAAEARFLDVPDGDSGITVTGATTSDGSPVTVTATCP